MADQPTPLQRLISSPTWVQWTDEQRRIGIDEIGRQMGFTPEQIPIVQDELLSPDENGNVKWAGAFDMNLYEQALRAPQMEQINAGLEPLISGGFEDFGAAPELMQDQRFQDAAADIAQRGFYDEMARPLTEGSLHQAAMGAVEGIPGLHGMAYGVNEMLPLLMQMGPENLGQIAAAARDGLDLKDLIGLPLPTEGAEFAAKVLDLPAKALEAIAGIPGGGVPRDMLAALKGKIRQESKERIQPITDKLGEASDAMGELGQAMVRNVIDEPLARTLEDVGMADEPKKAFLDWLGYTMGSGGASMAPVLATAAISGGSPIPALAVAGLMEGTDISSGTRKATGDFQPQETLPASVMAGALEALVPTKIVKGKGSQFWRNRAKIAGSHGLQEAGTEVTQLANQIAAQRAAMERDYAKKVEEYEKQYGKGSIEKLGESQTAEAKILRQQKGLLEEMRSKTPAQHLADLGEAGVRGFLVGAPASALFGSIFEPTTSEVEEGLEKAVAAFKRRADIEQGSLPGAPVPTGDAVKSARAAAAPEYLTPEETAAWAEERLDEEALPAIAERTGKTEREIRQDFAAADAEAGRMLELESQVSSEARTRQSAPGAAKPGQLSDTFESLRAEFEAEAQRVEETDPERAAEIRKAAETMRPVTPSTHRERILHGWLSRRGTELVLFESEGYAPLNGYVKGRGIVMVRASALKGAEGIKHQNQALSAIMLHEAGHQLRGQNPEAWRELGEILQESAPDTWAAAADFVSQNYEGLEGDDLTDEVISQAIERLTMSQPNLSSFWSTLMYPEQARGVEGMRIAAERKGQMTRWQKLRTWFQDLYTKIRRKIGAKDFGQLSGEAIMEQARKNPLVAMAEAFGSIEGAPRAEFAPTAEGRSVAELKAQAQQIDREGAQPVEEEAPELRQAASRPARRPSARGASPLTQRILEDTQFSDVVDYLHDPTGDAPAFMAQEYDLDSVTPEEVEAARREIAAMSQEMLADRGDTLLVYRGGNVPGAGPVSVTLTPAVARRFSERYGTGTIQSWRIPRSAVLSYSGINRGDYLEEEIKVDVADLEDGIEGRASKRIDYSEPAEVKRETVNPPRGTKTKGKPKVGDVPYEHAVEVKGPRKQGRSPIAKAIGPPNFEKTTEALDELAIRHPNPFESEGSALAFARDITRSNIVIKPPKTLVNWVRNPKALFRHMGKLSKAQIEAAGRGMEIAAAFDEAYRSSKADVRTTARIMLWSFLSRRQTAAAQESGFVDAMLAGIDEWIELALQRPWTEEDLNAYRGDPVVGPDGKTKYVGGWVNDAIPQGSPGRSVISNLNDFGANFLMQLSKQENGVPKLQTLHELIANREIPSQEVRRRFYQLGEKIGLGNKVLSFALLVTGRTDVVVLDRIQIRQLWGEANESFYDDVAPMFDGGHGLAWYEGIERSIEPMIFDAYAEIGRRDEGSIGRFHWESWVLNSGQVVGHPTLKAAYKHATGEEAPYADIGAPEGRMNFYAYGGEYRVAENGERYVVYNGPGESTYVMSLESWRDFLARIKRPATGVVPKGFQVGKAVERDENNNVVRAQPWYTLEGVNDARLEAVAREHADLGVGQRAAEAAQPDTTPAARPAKGRRKGRGAVRGQRGPGEVAPRRRRGQPPENLGKMSDYHVWSFAVEDAREDVEDLARYGDYPLHDINRAINSQAMTYFTRWTGRTPGRNALRRIETDMIQPTGTYSNMVRAAGRFDMSNKVRRNPEWIIKRLKRYGTTDEEIVFSGIREWLESNGGATKSELEEFLLTNGVDVDVVTLGEEIATLEPDEFMAHHVEWVANEIFQRLQLPKLGIDKGDALKFETRRAQMAYEALRTLGSMIPESEAYAPRALVQLIDPRLFDKSDILAGLVAMAYITGASPVSYDANDARRWLEKEIVRTFDGSAQEDVRAEMNALIDMWPDLMDLGRHMSWANITLRKFDQGQQVVPETTTKRARQTAGELSDALANFFANQAGLSLNQRYAKQATDHPKKEAHEIERGLRRIQSDLKLLGAIVKTYAGPLVDNTVVGETVGPHHKVFMDEIGMSDLGVALALIHEAQQTFQTTQETYDWIVSALGATVRRNEAALATSESLIHRVQEALDWVLRNWDQYSKWAGDSNTVVKTIEGALKESRKQVSDRTVYESWTQPYGTNYREVLFRLPKQATASERVRAPGRLSADDFTNRDHFGSVRVRSPRAQVGERVRAAAGLMAWARIDERILPDGRRVLFIDEIQSDIHQEGARAGYKGEPKSEAMRAKWRNGIKVREEELEKLRKEDEELRDRTRQIHIERARAHEAAMHEYFAEHSLFGLDYVRDKTGKLGIDPEITRYLQENPQELGEINKIRDRKMKARGTYESDSVEQMTKNAEKAEYIATKIETIKDEIDDLTDKLATRPQAWTPFTGTTWMALVMKHLIRVASEQGYDAIVWPRGEMHAIRWTNNMRGHIDKITWDARGKGNGKARNITLWKGGEIKSELEVNRRGLVWDDQNQQWIPAERLFPGTMGERIMSQDSGKIEGDDIVVGGRLYDHVYNEVMPSIIEKLVRTLNLPELKVESGRAALGESWGKPLQRAFADGEITQDRAKYFRIRATGKTNQETFSFHQNIADGTPLFIRVIDPKALDGSFVQGMINEDYLVVTNRQNTLTGTDWGTGEMAEGQIVGLSINETMLENDLLEHLLKLEEAGAVEVLVSKVAGLQNQYVDSTGRSRVHVVPLRQDLRDAAIEGRFSRWAIRTPGQGAEELPTREGMEEDQVLILHPGAAWDVNYGRAIDRWLNVAGGRSERFWFSLRRGLQDRMLRVKQLVEEYEGQVGPLPEAANIYLLEEQMYGKIQEILRSSSAKFFDPISRAMRRHNLSRETVDSFLMARHALERNRQGYAINLQRQLELLREKAEKQTGEAQEETYAEIARLEDRAVEGKIAGSGMTDLEAITVLNDLVEQGLLELDLDAFVRVYGYNSLREALDPELSHGARYDRMAEWNRRKAWPNLAMGGPLAEVAQLYDAMNEHKLEMAVEYGLVAAEEAEAIRAMYQYYAPLKGIEEEGDLEELLEGEKKGIGRFLDIRGKDIRRALGRHTRAPNSPLAQAMQDFHRVVIRGEKNVVGNAFLRFVQQNPNSNLWEVNRVKHRKIFDTKRGMVITQADYMDRLRPEVFMTKVGGEVFFIHVKDQRLATALKNLGPQNMSAFVEAHARAQRFLASMATSRNPEFILTNLIRDLQTAGINLSEEDPKAIRALLHVPTALAAIAEIEFEELNERRGEAGSRAARVMLRGIDRIPQRQRDMYKRYYREFREAGGKTGWADLADLEDYVRELERALAGGPGLESAGEALRRAGQAAKATARAARQRAGEEVLGGAAATVSLAGQGAGLAMAPLLDFIEAMNSVAENATRLMAYVYMRERGASKLRAASTARNLTVNFNRRGGWRNLSGLYMFANASLQGTARMFQAVTRSRSVRKMMAGTAAMGYSIALWNRMVLGEDDDGEDKWDKVSAWRKERTLMIAIPGTDGKFATIPLPYGYNVAYVIGQVMEQMMWSDREVGRKSTEGATDLLAAVVGAFNPLGGTIETPSMLVRNFIPTVFKIPYDLGMNTTFYGAPLARKSYDRLTPGYELARSHTPGVFTASAKMIDRLTGGDEYGIERGLVSPKPEQLQYLLEQVFGGVGKTATRTGITLTTLAKGDTPEIRDVPGARIFWTEYDQTMNTDLYYAAVERVLRARRKYRQASEEGDTRKARQIKLDYGPILDDELNKLRLSVEKELSKARESGNRDEMNAIMNKFLRVYNRAEARRR